VRGVVPGPNEHSSVCSTHSVARMLACTSRPACIRASHEACRVLLKPSRPLKERPDQGGGAASASCVATRKLLRQCRAAAAARRRSAHSIAGSRSRSGRGIFCPLSASITLLKRLYKGDPVVGCARWRPPPPPPHTGVRGFGRPPGPPRAGRQQRSYSPWQQAAASHFSAKHLCLAAERVNLAAERVEADGALASRRRGAAAAPLLLRRALLREGLAERNEIAAVGALHVLLGVRVDRVHAHNVLDAGFPAGRGTRSSSGPRTHGLSRGALPPARRCPNRTPVSCESPAWLARPWFAARMFAKVS